VSDENLEVTAQQIILYCLALVPVTVFPVVLGTAGWTYFTIAIFLNAMFTLFGIALARSRRRKHARWLFLASLAYLLFLLPSMVLDRL